MIDRFGHTQDELNQAVADALEEWNAAHPTKGRACIGSTKDELADIMRVAGERVGLDVDADETVEMLICLKVFTECTKHRGFYLAAGWRRGARGAEEWHNKRRARERAN